MVQTKERISGYLENLADDILMEWGCLRFWGEIEVPECILEEVKSNIAD